MEEILQKIADTCDVLEYDRETDQFTIEFSDVESIVDAYRFSPVVQIFIQHEIEARESATGVCDSTITLLSVKGFAYEEQGNEYTFQLEDLREMIFEPEKNTEMGERL